jgi:hypothetical protein
MTFSLLLKMWTVTKFWIRHAIKIFRTFNSQLNKSKELWKSQTRLLTFKKVSMLSKILRNILTLKHKKEKIEQISFKFLCLRSVINKAIQVVFKSKKHSTKAQQL